MPTRWVRESDPAEATGDDDAPTAGYVRFRFRRRGQSRESKAGSNVPYTVGDDARLIERAIDEQAADIAADAGTLWVEALWRGETNPHQSFRVDSDGGRSPGAAEVMSEQGATAGAMAILAGLVETLGRLNIETQRELLHVTQGSLSAVVHAAVLADREEGVHALADAKARDAMWSAVAPELGKVGAVLVETPAIQAMLAKLGGVPVSLDEEGPTAPRERAVWSLARAADALDDAVSVLVGEVTADAEVQATAYRMRTAAMAALHAFEQAQGGQTADAPQDAAEPAEADDAEGAADASAP